jgi:hypothetical protein
LADDEAFAGGLDDLARDGREVVDVKHPLDPGNEPVDDAEVARKPATVAIASVSVRFLGGQPEAQRSPVVGEDEVAARRR